MNVNDLLNPKYLKSIDDLNLVSKLIVENLFDGINISNRSGFGQEFSQYRNYQAGDDPRFVDWKLFARSERYFVKLSDVESHLRLRLIIDSSKSMDYSGSNYKKLDYAKFLLAGLSYIGYKQHDEIILNSINDHEIQNINFSQLKSVNPVLQAILQIDPIGKFPGNVRQIVEQLNIQSKREIIIFISDLYEETEEISQFIKLLALGNNDINLFHLITDDEVNYTEENILYKDMETGEIFNTSKNKNYLNKMNLFLEKSKNFAKDNNIYYQLINNDNDYFTSLRNFIKGRVI